MVVEVRTTDVLAWYSDRHTTQCVLLRLLVKRQQIAARREAIYHHHGWVNAHYCMCVVTPLSETGARRGKQGLVSVPKLSYTFRPLIPRDQASSLPGIRMTTYS